MVVAWGWPVWDAENSALESHIHHAQPTAVMADFGFIKDTDTRWDPFAVHDPWGNEGKGAYVGANQFMWRGAERDESASIRAQARRYHHVIGNITLGVVLLAFALAASVYYFHLLDPAEAVEQFPGVYNFLAIKWYFDTVYSALLVRPFQVTGCPVHNSRHSRNPSSMRPTRFSNGTPQATNSARIFGTSLAIPTPRMKRPSLIWSSVAMPCASTTGLRSAGSNTAVPSSALRVRAATADSRVSGSCRGRARIESPTQIES